MNSKLNLISLAHWHKSDLSFTLSGILEKSFRFQFFFLTLEKNSQLEMFIGSVFRASHCQETALKLPMT